MPWINLGGMPVWVDDPIRRIPTAPPRLPPTPPYFYDPSAPPFTPDPTVPKRTIAYTDQELLYSPPPPITYPEQDLLPPALPPEPPPDPWVPVRARGSSLSGPLGGSRVDDDSFTPDPTAPQFRLDPTAPAITYPEQDLLPPALPPDPVQLELAQLRADVAALTAQIENATVQDVITPIADPQGGTGPDVTTEGTGPSFTYPDMYGTDPDLFPILWAQSFGIPERGRSRYEQFLADQWRPAAAEYLLRADPEFGGLPQVGDFQQPFSQFLSGRPKLPGMQRNFLSQLTDLDPRVQVDILQGMGDQEDFVTREVFRHGLQGTYPSFIANNLTRQAFSPESRGYFETSPEALSVGEEGVLPFLNYLRSKYRV
jgi:hypothetical protein